MRFNMAFISRVHSVDYSKSRAEFQAMDSVTPNAFYLNLFLWFIKQVLDVFYVLRRTALQDQG